MCILGTVSGQYLLVNLYIYISIYIYITISIDCIKYLLGWTQNRGCVAIERNPQKIEKEHPAKVVKNVAFSLFVGSY